MGVVDRAARGAGAVIVERQADTAAKVMVPRVLGVFVHTIYEAINFAELDP